MQIHKRKIVVPLWYNFKPNKIKPKFHHAHKLHLSKTLHNLSRHKTVRQQNLLFNKNAKMW